MTKQPEYRIVRKGCRWYPQRKRWWGWAKIAVSGIVYLTYYAENRAGALDAIDHDLAEWRKEHSPILIEDVKRPPVNLNCVP